VRTRKQRVLIVALVVALAAGVASWQRVRSAAQPEAAPNRAVGAELAGRGARAAQGSPPARATASGSERRSEAAAPAEDDAASRAKGNDPATAERDASGASAALGGSAEAAGPRAIYVLAEAPGEGRISTQVSGVDTGAPRELVLWRVQDGRRVRLADGFSTSDGALHFPAVLVPDRLELVVSAAEAGPEGADESDSARVQAGALRPPQLELRRAPDGALAIRVAASRALGSVIFANPAGDEIARVPVPGAPIPARRVLDVRLPADRVRGEILVAHELPDGARSAWRPYAIPPALPASEPEPEATEPPDSSTAPNS
jgi:hypothetical protein